MKKKQQKTQLILISIGLLLILLTYFYYPYMSKDKLLEDQSVLEDLEKTLDDDQLTTFENVLYEGTTSNMQKFSVKSETAYILDSDPDLLYMKNMQCEIYLNDGRTIKISGDRGRYQKETHDFWFEENVVTSDGETIIFSDNLDLLATENYAQVYNNVILNHSTGSILVADKIDYDFETKHFKASMTDNKAVKMKVIQ